MTNWLRKADEGFNVGDWVRIYKRFHDGEWEEIPDAYEGEIVEINGNNYKVNVDEIFENGNTRVIEVSDIQLEKLNKGLPQCINCQNYINDKGAMANYYTCGNPPDGLAGTAAVLVHFRNPPACKNYIKSLS